MSKKKLTLKDLAPVPYTFNLVHPTAGELDSTITMHGPNSKQFLNASIEANKAKGAETDVDEMSPGEILSQTASLYSNIIVDWDEEFFQCKCTATNVEAILGDFENQWINTQITEILKEHENFFTK